MSVGSFLSGGLDSTIVTELSNTEHSWTAGFETMNEFKWGRLASDHIKTTHHELVVDKDSFKETLDFMIKKRQEPLSVPNEVMLYLMSKFHFFCVVYSFCNIRLFILYYSVLFVFYLQPI